MIDPARQKAEPEAEVDHAWLNPRNLLSWKWRVRNLYTVVNKDGVIEPFVPNEAQERFMEEMHGTDVILKARQLGFSTFIQIIMLDSALWVDNTSCGTISESLPAAKILLKKKMLDVYDRLPAMIRAMKPITKRDATEVHFANGSTVRVGTSLRGDTFQILHVSELGKIAAKFPEKAREIKTGALNTVAPGQHIFIESTAEGQIGLFYELCQQALTRMREGEREDIGEFKIHFFPWYQDHRYILHTRKALTRKTVDYFKALTRVTGIVFTKEQMSWYQQQAAKQGKDMKREYPSTPEEAFEASVEGAIFRDEIERVYDQNRVGDFKYDPSLGSVFTFWDIGRNDHTVIWIGQRLSRSQWQWFYVVAEKSKSLPYFVDELKELKQRFRFTWGGHFLPHDGGNTDWSVSESRKTQVENYGLYPCAVVPRAKELNKDLEFVRPFIEQSWFDAQGAGDGLKMLQNYRWKHDEKLDVMLPTPLHDDASHYADAYRTAAAAQRLNMVDELEYAHTVQDDTPSHHSDNAGGY